MSVVQLLKEHLSRVCVNHDIEIMKTESLKRAHIYCVLNNLTSQKYGTSIEKYIREKYNFKKNKAKDCIGDVSKNGENIEIKVSLGGATHTKFNYVQLRPSHDCHKYLFTAYHLSEKNVESEGELFIFQVPKEDLKKLITLYGGYAHGTVKELGEITIESLNKEYDIRPSINSKCWNALMAFRIDEIDL